MSKTDALVSLYSVLIITNSKSAFWKTTQNSSKICNVHNGVRKRELPLYTVQTKPQTVFVFYRSTFVGSAWSFVFFIPATTDNDLRLRRIFYLRFYQLHIFSYLNS